MTTIVTHNGIFHADDVFGTALLCILYPEAEIIRSRDEDIITTADFKVDVGGVNDPEKNAFDHHQTDGAGARPNGIPFSSFGLTWKKFGLQLCGTQEIADRVDQVLVQQIDGTDNKWEFWKEKGLTNESVMPLLLSSVVTWFNPIGDEPRDPTTMNEIFMQLVGIAQLIIRRAVITAKAFCEARSVVEPAIKYANQNGAKAAIFGSYVIWQEHVLNNPQSTGLLYVIYESQGWKVQGIPVKLESPMTRKPFPKHWWGLQAEALQKVTGVSGAKFAHANGFLVGAETREAAEQLAALAIAFEEQK